jgi:hypothetical protein
MHRTLKGSQRNPLRAAAASNRVLVKGHYVRICYGPSSCMSRRNAWKRTLSQFPVICFARKFLLQDTAPCADFRPSGGQLVGSGDARDTTNTGGECARSSSSPMPPRAAKELTLITMPYVTTRSQGSTRSTHGKFWLAAVFSAHHSSQLPRGHASAAWTVMLHLACFLQVDALRSRVWRIARC